MESWQGMSYEDIMAMPTTRRYRLLLQKSELERRRLAEHRASIARMR